MLATTLAGCSPTSGERSSTDGTTKAPATQAPPAGSQGAASGTPLTEPAPRSPHAGVWAGTFKAERAEVTVPEGVPYDSWKEDPGGAEGEGRLELIVSGDGVVSGKATGALGALLAAGMIEDGRLSAGLSPEEADGMSGVLSGSVSNGVLAASLRVASGDASVVRKATIELERD